MRTIFLSALALGVAGCGIGPDSGEQTLAPLIPRVSFGARQLKAHPDEGARVPLLGDLDDDPRCSRRWQLPRTNPPGRGLARALRG